MSFLNTNQCNVKTSDAYLRLILSFVLLIISITTQCYILMLFSTVLAYTGIKRHCFLYDIFKINKTFSLKNYYMSHLPKYNPSAVFMFDKNGKIYFANSSATKEFEHIKNFKDFNISKIDEIIKTQLEDTFYYQYNELHYQLDIKGVKEINCNYRCF
ncbi:MAG: DUF2892 domain-containing protein [Campylobacterota bacterium]|nr:DUF2892 domain-containing protein [Campylobacterota bacterium]